MGPFYEAIAVSCRVIALGFRARAKLIQGLKENGKVVDCHLKILNSSAILLGFVMFGCCTAKTRREWTSDLQKF